MDEHDVIVNADGSLAFVYSDDLVDLLALGDATVTRASHVEPHPTKRGWIADMAPSGGPVLGFGCSTSDVNWSKVCQECWSFPNRCDHVSLTAAELTPFQTRQAALDAERRWLREHRGL